jgi:hypothetical protein
VFLDLKSLQSDDRIVLTTLEHLSEVDKTNAVVVDIREDNQKW